jgi:predicted nucleotidyltransferase component of viral defense system
MERISEAKLRNIAADKGFNIIFLEKDYFLTVLFYYLRDFDGIFFKGGTALNKIFLDHTRLSEDLDFTSTSSISHIKKKVDEIVKQDNEHFRGAEYEKEKMDFARIKVFYKSYFQKESYIFIDANRKASIHLKAEKKKVNNFYNLDFEMTVLNISELTAEKMRAAITRNKPRDYFDLYFILKKYDIDMLLIRKKVEEAEKQFDLRRIFKSANKIYSKWDEDVKKLTNRDLSFEECITFLHKELKKAN